jgi:hypothetical protein
MESFAYLNRIEVDLFKFDEKMFKDLGKRLPDELQCLTQR